MLIQAYFRMQYFFKQIDFKNESSMNDGEISELLASIFLSRKTDQGYLFKTVLIGGKYPSIDLYAEILGDNSPKNYCFFQVKSTIQGYTKRDNRLLVQITKDKLNRLSNFNAPTYLIGIDYKEDDPFSSIAYIAAIRGEYTRGLPSMPTHHVLNEENLIQLKNEIEAFWQGTNTFGNKNRTNSIFDL